MIRITCWQCRKPFRWTLIKCPRCMQRNAHHPIILFCKVLAVAALCVAIWYLVQAFVKTDDTASGVVHPGQEKEPPRSYLYPTPSPTPAPDPRFPR
jgi:hypothetical protein